MSAVQTYNQHRTNYGNPSACLRRQLPLHRGAKDVDITHAALFCRGAKEIASTFAIAIVFEEKLMDYKSNKNLTPVTRILRRNMTREERRLWFEFLKYHDAKFYRQRAVGKYVVDFYCASAQLVIELDGSQHYEAEGIKHDIERDNFLEQYGISVLHIPNSEINSNFKGVCDYIDDMVRSRAASIR